jgi:hypothetical protein
MKVGMYVLVREVNSCGAASALFQEMSFSSSRIMERALPPNRIRHSLGDAMQILKLVRPSVLALRPTTSSSACRPRLRIIPTVHMSRMAAHGDLIIFQVAGPTAACSGVFRRVAGGAAELGSDSKDVAEDVFEKGFEGWDRSGEEACVGLGADPDC